MPEEERFVITPKGWWCDGYVRGAINSGRSTTENLHQEALDAWDATQRMPTDLHGRGQ